MAERKLGVTERRQRRFERVAESPVTSERKLMTTIKRDHEHGGALVAITKGAPEVLLGRCTQVRMGMATSNRLTRCRQQLHPGARGDGGRGAG